MNQYTDSAGNFITTNGKNKTTYFVDGTICSEVYSQPEEGQLLSKIMQNSDGSIEISTTTNLDVQLINNTNGSQVVVGGDGNITIAVANDKDITLKGNVKIEGTFNTI